VEPTLFFESHPEMVSDFLGRALGHACICGHCHASQTHHAELHRSPLFRTEYLSPPLKLSHGPGSYPVKKVSQKENLDYWTFVLLA